MHLARCSCSFMGSRFKVPLARGSDPLGYIGLFQIILVWVEFVDVGLSYVRLRWVVLSNVRLG